MLTICCYTSSRRNKAFLNCYKFSSYRDLPSFSRSAVATNQENTIVFLVQNGHLAARQGHVLDQPILLGGMICKKSRIFFFLLWVYSSKRVSRFWHLMKKEIFSTCYKYATAADWQLKDVALVKSPCNTFTRSQESFFLSCLRGF